MIVPPSTILRVTLQEGAARRLLLSSDAVARVVRVFQRWAPMLSEPKNSERPTAVKSCPPPLVDLAPTAQRSFASSWSHFKQIGLGVNFFGGESEALLRC